MQVRLEVVAGPESGRSFDFVEADVYAVGVSLYFLLTAQYTVDFPAPQQIVAMAARGRKPKNPIQIILEEQPIPIRTRRPQVPPDLAAIVDRSVQKENERRHRSATEFRTDLEKVMLI